jgi:hypothetical protein
METSLFFHVMLPYIPQKCTQMKHLSWEWNYSTIGQTTIVSQYQLLDLQIRIILTLASFNSKDAFSGSSKISSGPLSTWQTTDKYMHSTLLKQATYCIVQQCDEFLPTFNCQTGVVLDWGEFAKPKNRFKQCFTPVYLHCVYLHLGPCKGIGKTEKGWYQVWVKYYRAPHGNVKCHIQYQTEGENGRLWETFPWRKRRVVGKPAYLSHVRFGCGWMQSPKNPI